MATKQDLQILTSTLHDTIKTEMALIRTEVTVQGMQIQALEHTTQGLMTRIAATYQALARQGTMLLEMRSQMEDLDNCSRQCNLRVRGIPEPNDLENVERILTSLFQAISGEAAPTACALRPRSDNSVPRDIICCLSSFKQEETIMLKARSRNSWEFQGA
ncbi:Hypothetical predicted protein [Pelobates cultripes]|uniref:Uncharacterized protein n=1 Tax=Pelobates cultripes TaxID=61616 RepID=A0AAD1WV43_PELCU|nr:Hypothetical predicted protein [Pelobates cultripes]CAH2330408.1 Hypothetical predicted protein [Pelobates cultripes]